MLLLLKTSESLDLYTVYIWQFVVLSLLKTFNEIIHIYKVALTIIFIMLIFTWMVQRVKTVTADKVTWLVVKCSCGIFLVFFTVRMKCRYEIFHVLSGNRMCLFEWLMMKWLWNAKWQFYCVLNYCKLL